MGREAQYENRVGVTANLEKKELEALEEIQWREHKTKSQIIRLAILEYIKAHTNGNSTFKLDVWTNDPKFKAVPTVYADTDNWDKYLENCSSAELEELHFRFSRCADKCKEQLSC